MATRKTQIQGEPGFLARITYFLRHSKRWWLGPIVVFLLLIIALILFTESSSVAPFVYDLF
jgi:hypothetical protein